MGKKWKSDTFSQIILSTYVNIISFDIKCIRYGVNELVNMAEASNHYALVCVNVKLAVGLNWLVD